MRESLRTTNFGPADVLSFESCLRRQLDLCSELEDLADSLPGKVDTRAATDIARRLLATLRRCHRLEEAFVFPVLSRTCPEMPPILDRLRREHMEDEGHACDVQETIEAFVTRPIRRDADELGYMLRCLFVSLRRHLAFDRDHLLPLYRRSGGL